MDSENPRKPSLKSWAVVLTAYAASRLIYAYAGIVFNTGPIYGFWQVISQDLLKNDLLRSVFYLHSQPPVYNLLIGAAMKLTPYHYGTVLQAVYILVGLALTASLHALMVRLGVSSRISAALTVAFMASPAAILFENWLFYDYPVAAMLAAAALYMHRYVSGRRQLDGTIFFGLLALVIWSRNLFHYVWFFAFLAALMAGRADRKAVYRAAWLPLALVLILYAKNAFVFGNLTGGDNAWLGMNFAQATTFKLPQHIRHSLSQHGELSPLGMIPPYGTLDKYGNFTGPRQKTGIPVLDKENKTNGLANFHNIAYLGISRQYMKDGIYSATHYPGIYLGVVWGNYISWSGPPDIVLVHQEGVEAFEEAYDAVLYGRIPRGYADQITTDSKTKKALNAGFFVLLGLPILVIYGLAKAWNAARGKNPDPALAYTLAFILATVLYVTLTVNMTTVNELNRIRFTIDPLLLVLLGLLLNDIAAGLRKRLKDGKTTKMPTISPP